MRQIQACLAVGTSLLAVVGCVSEVFLLENQPVGDVIEALTVSGSGSDSSAASSADASPSSLDPAPVASTDAQIQDFSGEVTGFGPYRLFDLGSGNRGDYWQVSANGPLSGPFIVVLLDANENLLMRMYLHYQSPLQLVLRDDTEQLLLGVMPPASGSGGSFRLRAKRTAGQPVPAARRQVVWLNFAGGDDLRVHTRDPISFPAFDAATIGEAYAGHTQEIKDLILQEMRADYAAYDVQIYSSDDGPPPVEGYSTVHFGGDESGLLGLADGVDNYNESPEQNALVYVDNFAAYWTMQLEPDEMAVMIANVASHELGHLIGLYHTKDPDDLMDTTGSAWDLAENQGFTRAPLEDTVFATGWEDSPVLLRQIVGSDPDADKAPARQKPAKWATYAAIRRYTQQELASACGTCLNLDHE